MCAQKGDRLGGWSVIITKGLQNRMKHLEMICCQSIDCSLCFVVIH